MSGLLLSKTARPLEGRPRVGLLSRAQEVQAKLALRVGILQIEVDRAPGVGGRLIEAVVARGLLAHQPKRQCRVRIDVTRTRDQGLDLAQAAIA